MSITKAEIIEAYGVKDGNDEYRYLSALTCVVHENPLPTTPKPKKRN